LLLAVSYAARVPQIYTLSLHPLFRSLQARRGPADHGPQPGPRAAAAPRAAGAAGPSAAAVAAVAAAAPEPARWRGSPPRLADADAARARGQAEPAPRAPAARSGAGAAGGGARRSALARQRRPRDGAQRLARPGGRAQADGARVPRPRALGRADHHRARPLRARAAVAQRRAD